MSQWVDAVPDHWRRIRLKNLIEHVRNGTWGQEPDPDEPGTVCIRAADFDRHRNRVSEAKLIRRSLTPADVTKHRLQPGDLVLEKSGGGEQQPVGAAVMFDLETPAVPTNFAAGMRPARHVEPRFLNYVLRATYNLGINQRSIKQTTGLQNLDTDSFLAERWAAPEREEQRAIADFLDREAARIDALITKKRKLVARVSERENAWVERTVLGIDGKGKKESSTGFFVHCPLGWAETTLRHLGCEVQTGPFGSQLHAEDYVEGGWPVVNPANLQKGEIVPIRGMAISEEKRDQLRRHVLRVGDIVFGRRGEMGRAGLVEEKHAGWLCGTGSIRLRLQRSPLKPEYLKLLLETRALRTYFELSSIGSTMDNLNSEIILALPCLMPSHKEQQEIVRAVTQSSRRLKDLRTKLENQVALLAEHRQALITAAVTGQMDIPSVA